MSRSYRKNLIATEKNKSFYKRYSNKVFRKRSFDLTNINPNRLVSAYNITDYRYLMEDNYKARCK